MSEVMMCLSSISSFLMSEQRGWDICSEIPRDLGIETGPECTHVWAAKCCRPKYHRPPDLWISGVSWSLTVMQVPAGQSLAPAPGGGAELEYLLHLPSLISHRSSQEEAR